MRLCATFLKTLLAFCICAGTVQEVFAQTTAEILPTRKMLQTTYLQNQRDAWTLFAGVPVTHVVPKRDKVTFNFGGDYAQTNVIPAAGTSGFQSSSSDSASLKISGYRATPLVVFQESRFGIGFLADVGEKKTTYIDSSSYSENGDMKFSGFGISTYAIPTISFLPNNVTTSLVSGIKKDYVEHTGTQNYPHDEPSFSVSQKARYSVVSGNLGADLSVLLARRFTVMPWFDYRRMMGISPNSTSYTTILETNKPIIGDIGLFWNNEVRYGIDFGVQIQRVNIKLGGALGYVAGLAKGSDQITDSSFSVALSVDF